MTSPTIRPILIETNYALVERNSDTVSILWLAFQIIFLGLAATSGVVCCYCFFFLKGRIEDNCILYSKLIFIPDNPQNRTFQIDPFMSEWGTDECDFILYEAIVATIIALFFITMSIICGRGGAGFRHGLLQPWRIILPLFLANLLCSSLSLAATLTFFNGVKDFCLNLNHYRRDSSSTEWCDPIKELYIKDVNVGEDLFWYLGTNQIVLWLTFVLWCLSFCWSIVRCVCIVDFRLVRSRIYDYPGTTDDLIREDFLRNSEEDYISVTSSRSHPSSDVMSKPTKESSKNMIV